MQTQNTQQQQPANQTVPQIVDPATQAAIGNKSHTILLIQFTADETSKTFIDYDDIGKCVDGVCPLYE